MSRVKEDDPLFSNVRKRSSLITFSSPVLLKKMLVVLQHPVVCNIGIMFKPNKESIKIKYNLMIILKLDKINKTLFFRITYFYFFSQCRTKLKKDFMLEDHIMLLLQSV